MILDANICAYKKKKYKYVYSLPLLELLNHATQLPFATSLQREGESMNKESDGGFLNKVFLTKNLRLKPQIR